MLKNLFLTFSLFSIALLAQPAHERRLGASVTVLSEVTDSEGRRHPAVSDRPELMAALNKVSGDAARGRPQE